MTNLEENGRITFDKCQKKRISRKKLSQIWFKLGLNI